MVVTPAFFSFPTPEVKKRADTLITGKVRFFQEHRSYFSGFLATGISVIPDTVSLRLQLERSLLF